MLTTCISLRKIKVNEADSTNWLLRFFDVVKYGPEFKHLTLTIINLVPKVQSAFYLRNY